MNGYTCSARETGGRLGVAARREPGDWERFAALYESMHQVATDEPGSAGHEDHVLFSSLT